MTLSCETYKPQSSIIKINDEADSIYFLLTGTVEVVGETGTVHAEMQSGSFFGEVGILLNMKRTANIRAKDDVTLFKLTKSGLESVIVDYPDMQTKLKETADKRYELMMLRSKAAADAAAAAAGTSESSGGNGSKAAVAAHAVDQFDLEVSEMGLSKLGIFQGVEPSILSEIAVMMQRKSWNKSDMVLKCGDQADSMFFLAAGDVDVISEVYILTLVVFFNPSIFGLMTCHLYNVVRRSRGLCVRSYCLFW
jgi:F-box/leucine-rich repeat protein 7